VEYESVPNGRLLAACARSGDAEIWKEFVRRFHSLIAAVVLRTCRRYTTPESSLVEDLIQETYLKLCLSRERFSDDFESHPDAAFGFMKVVAANVVHDYFKLTKAAKRGSGERLESLDDDERGSGQGQTGGANEIERKILLGQIDRVLQVRLKGSEKERDRSIFWLHHRQGLSARLIAALPSIRLTEKGVQSTLWRLTQTVKEEMCRKRPGEDT
jgi:RNA polymerase sigma-70 factor (ECF subfamily)